MTCPSSFDDGAFVLGALGPTERLAFERHMAECAACAESVRELAGLPGLLSSVSADALDPSAEAEPLPDTLLPRLVEDVNRVQRHRTRIVAGLAAAAAVVVSIGAATVWGVVREADSPQQGVPVAVGPERSMVGVGQDVLHARVGLDAVPWGTRLRLTCAYDAEEYAAPPPKGGVYILVVRTSDGSVERVASWRALPGKTMQVQGATAVQRENIKAVQVRTSSGRPLLTLAG